MVDQMPNAAVQKEIDAALNVEHMEKTLMDEGIQKFCDPQKVLLGLIATKRKELGK
jgi:transaldolase